MWLERLKVKQTSRNHSMTENSRWLHSPGSLRNFERVSCVSSNRFLSLKTYKWRKKCSWKSTTSKNSCFELCVRAWPSSWLSHPKKAHAQGITIVLTRTCSYALNAICFADVSEDNSEILCFLFYLHWGIIDE